MIFQFRGDWTSSSLRPYRPERTVCLASPSPPRYVSGSYDHDCPAFASGASAPARLAKICLVIDTLLFSALQVSCPRTRVMTDVEGEILQGVEIFGGGSSSPDCLGNDSLLDAAALFSTT